MERHAMVVNVVPELREEYLRLHSAVWPQVEATLSACHVTNYSIYLLEGTLFAYYEYVGTDHEADMARIAEDPVTQDWWTRTDPCQTPFGVGTTPGQRWRDLREIWHLA
ncbi:L-rhamnose mutarotase [Pengzhenrongella sicca]|uniref:L-rhamnose mutarotase n=1 Tax=Pengzhenrongella sicca TaxID=2819238 RepID=A0A8A4ZDW4_9MICO|nr:L-rhamnose mutarotase [Pengzhenrongella sicca]QTE27898.1 L-rhamnose mutarotase [Pengzhenrongella sicca]